MPPPPEPLPHRPGTPGDASRRGAEVTQDSRDLVAGVVRDLFEEPEVFAELLPVVAVGERLRPHAE